MGPTVTAVQKRVGLATCQKKSLSELGSVRPDPFSSVALTDPSLSALLPLASQCWDYRSVSPRLMLGTWVLREKCEEGHYLSHNRYRKGGVSKSPFSCLRTSFCSSRTLLNKDHSHSRQGAGGPLDTWFPLSLL